MPLEQEIVPKLLAGFSIVMGGTILCVLLLWVRTKRNSAGYLWMLIHFLIFSAAVYIFIQAMNYRADHTMVSEEISLRVGVAGMTWAVSMKCLVISLFCFSKSRSVVD
ncbi:hypothetical protein [Bacillus sp. SG-1]|uniref:hypothetical protein n=1 Tax=Bacillus sp. SG-1 TaxID=161544 RepID=UPI00015434CF|nr:hypothetical protein [Bacillus sp. SG-1]EDL66298.1 hypothetical protein BSG1_03060 [Bacillus sp. SG-1]